MSIDQKSFDKNYFYNICLGSDEFKKTGGRKLHPKVKSMIDAIGIRSSMNVLDIGCGRGDITLYVAKRAKSVTGIDYSTEAIKIANRIKKKYPPKIKGKTKFYVMSATDLNLKENSFDLILLIDIFDHLSIKEQEKMLNAIVKLLKVGGEIYLKTCANKILLSQTYKYHIYPINQILTKIDKVLKNTYYEGLPTNPRTHEQMHQHINESEYFRLKKILNKHGFEGKISCEVGFLKEGENIRTHVYNFLITLYPLSKYFPLSYFYAGSFTAKFKLIKKQVASHSQTLPTLKVL